MIVMVVSMVVAAVASAIALRLWTEDRRRSRARVALLAQAIQPATLTPALADAGGISSGSDLPLRASAPAVRTHDLFNATAADERPAISRWGVAVAAAVFVVAAIAAIAVLLDTDAPAMNTAAPSPTRAAAPPAAAAEAVPLELMALTHERDGDQLTVRGVVRNPPSGAEMDRLIAVVFLFDKSGGFLTSGRAPVAATALLPGGETTFGVSVPAADSVSRYRVSFRSDERVVSHVDRRTTP